MKAAPRLVLKRESLTALTTDDLTNVVGAATLGDLCGGPTTTRVTVIVTGCPTNPQVCHYYSFDYC